MFPALFVPGPFYRPFWGPWPFYRISFPNGKMLPMAILKC